MSESAAMNLILLSCEWIKSWTKKLKFCIVINLFKLEFAFLENNSAASCGEVEVSRWDRLRQTCDFSTGEV